MLARLSDRGARGMRRMHARYAARRGKRTPAEMRRNERDTPRALFRLRPTREIRSDASTSSEWLSGMRALSRASKRIARGGGPSPNRHGRRRGNR